MANLFKEAWAVKVEEYKLVKACEVVRCAQIPRARRGKAKAAEARASANPA